MNELQLIEEVKTGNLVSVKRVIESGADVNRQDEQGWTPLNWAAGKGKLDIVTLLVNQGADVFKVGRDQRTPYLIALAAGHAEVARFLQQAEDQVPGEKPTRPERKYCKAYLMQELRRFSNWVENKINLRDEPTNHTSDHIEEKHQPFTDEAIAFLHQDYTVTHSMWHNENVIFNQVTPEWKEFCSTVLKFKVPDDLDLIVNRTSEQSASATR